MKLDMILQNQRELLVLIKAVKRPDEAEVLTELFPGSPVQEEMKKGLLLQTIPTE